MKKFFSKDEKKKPAATPKVEQKELTPTVIANITSGMNRIEDKLYLGSFVSSSHLPTMEAYVALPFLISMFALTLLSV